MPGNSKRRGAIKRTAKGNATAYGELPTEAFTEQAVIVAELEQKLRETVNMSKINYLMLMMVDPHVHFHIFPRYRGTRSFAGLVLTDHGWPGPPDIKSAVELDSAAIGQAVESLR